MITDVTRQDLIDLFNAYDPEPVISMLAEMGAGKPPQRGISWWGRLDESEFLARLYDLDALPSLDPRFATAGDDIRQHRMNNLDWDNDWIFYDDRFELATSDDRLLRLLAETLHPAVRSDREEGERLRVEYNRILRPDRVEICQVSTISGRPVFAGGPATPRTIQPQTLRKAIGEAIRNEFKAYDVEAYCDEIGMPVLPSTSYARPESSKASYVVERLAGCNHPELIQFARVVQDRCADRDLEALLVEIDWSGQAGVAGTPKNIVFASDGPKPDIVLVDAVNNDLRIVRNAEHCLIYDRPINPDAGVSFQALVDWWDESHPTDPGTKPENDLHRRLLQGQNEAERALFNGYAAILALHGFALPALIPQVYLHYDPETAARRAATSGAALERQRMDFLMLLPGRHRVVIELDGRHHYATADGTASPRLYAEMMVEDRRLRLTGYEVYRFGGYELLDLDKGKQLAAAFFTELLKRHGVL